MAVKIKNSIDILKYRKLTPENGSKIYRQLRHDVTQAGILDRDYNYYTVLTIFTFFCFFLCLYLFYLQSSMLAVLISGVFLAFFIVQIGGLIHDAGHRAIFNKPKINDMFGYMCSFIIAFPYAVWKVKHNKHHAHTNESEEDPDLQIPLAFVEDRYKNHGGIVRLVRRYQKWLYYPMGSLVSFSLRLKAFIHYVKNYKTMGFDMTLSIIGLLFWYIAPFFVFPLWKALIFLIVVNEVAGFYLLNIFAPNHKGMPQIGEDVKFSFLEQQIITSRNIYGHTLTDYVYLGLNYQIEHHLFPNCPRNKIHLIAPFVKKICKSYHLPYTQMTPLESNRFILAELDAIAKTTPKN